MGPLPLWSFLDCAGHVLLHEHIEAFAFWGTKTPLSSAINVRSDPWAVRTFLCHYRGPITSQVDEKSRSAFLWSVL